MVSRGSSTVRAPFPCNSIRTFPFANPARRPSKNLASSTGSVVVIFANRPRNRSKSVAFFSARSIPGELTSRMYRGPGTSSSTSKITLSRWLGHAVDVHAQKPLLADFPFDINDFQPFRTRHPLGGGADLLQIHYRDSSSIAGLHYTPPGPNKKVGSRPLVRSTRFRAKWKYIPPARQKQDTGPPGVQLKVRVNSVQRRLNGG